MQPISILGPGAADLAATLAGTLDGRVAVVERDVEPPAGGEPNETDGGASTAATGTSAETVPDRPGTTVALAADGTWHGSGIVGGFDDLLDRFAPDHDYLVAVGYTRLRVPTVLLGDDETGADDVPGDVILQAESPGDVDVESLVESLDTAEPWITLEELVAEVREAEGADRSGAIATFTGRVRAKEHADDERTTHLAFEKYEGVARERMDAISAELEERDGVFRVLMHHRTGVIEDGEDIVFVVVLAGHREESFRTVEDGINRLKDEVPIFKKETTESEAFWVHQK